MILRHCTAVRSARSAEECRVPDYAASPEFAPVDVGFYLRADAA
jgi:hypothetical protein